MFLSLLTGAITVLNAAGFLLMAAGPELLEYIVVSSIFSVASWLYTWMLPAAVAYDPARIGLLRLLQTITVGIASALILATHASVIGWAFVVLMLIDASVFPAHMLLFRSRTDLFVRSEFVRGIANSLALLAALFFLGRSPQSYVLLLLVNFIVGSALLMALGVHRPPSLVPARLSALSCIGGRSFWSRQLLALLAARSFEMGALIGLSRLGALSPVISLRIGMSISSALAMNARARSLPLLVAMHLLIYGGGTAAILLLRRIPQLPLPDTLDIITPLNALYVVPIILAAFVLSVIGLRVSVPAPVKVGEP